MGSDTAREIRSVTSPIPGMISVEKMLTKSHDVGPVVRISPKEVSVAEPSATQQIYSIKNEFRKSPWYKDLIPGVDNIFSTIDVEYHRRHRRLLASEISESGLVQHRPAVESKVRMAIERMAEEMEERGVAVS